MTSLTFYGGVNEIGGNKILLEDKDTKIFLDFGKSFSRRSQFFEEYLNPRTANGITDFQVMGLIPNLKGVYRDDLMNMSYQEIVEPEIDGVLLSHAHADHADYISFLHEDIPIYMGETSHFILKALEERSTRTLEKEILRYVPRPYDRRHKPIERIIKTFRTGDKFKIGSLEIEPIHVDHSILGAYGFIIYTSVGPIVYTGDFRVHGTRAHMTKNFIEKTRNVKPVALITEGTRINDETREESEDLVYKESSKIVSSTNRLVLADFNFKDTDRMQTFYKIAKENDRKLVVKLNDAYFLKYLSQIPKLNVPSPTDDNVIIYLPKKGSGAYLESDYTSKETQFLDLHNALSAKQIAAQESKVLCAIGFYSFTALIDMKPKAGSVYIHSASEPYNEEQVISQSRIDNWLAQFGMNKFQIHCSGHARGKDLLEAVKEINAKTIYPIHTEHPKSFESISKNVVIVQEGIRYEL